MEGGGPGGLSLGVGLVQGRTGTRLGAPLSATSRLGFIPFSPGVFVVPSAKWAKLWSPQRRGEVQSNRRGDCE